MIRPEDPIYDEVRKIHNGMIDRKPAVIVRCAGTADVLNCVRLAQETGIVFSIRSGGHSVPGFGVCDGGLMIDLSAMNGVRVDAARRTARAQAGATWGDFDHETHAYGLATTGGVMRTGDRWTDTGRGATACLMRKYGLGLRQPAIGWYGDRRGRVVTASEDENPDLFWGLRGGGGNFGIVTSFEYRLHPVRMVTGGLLAYPLVRRLACCGPMTIT